jgi:hypothetical protein
LVPVAVASTTKDNGWTIPFQEVEDCIDSTIDCWFQYHERTV